MRHKWGKEKFSGSFVSHSWKAVCVQCGAIRERRWDYGQRDVVYQDSHGEYAKRAPACEEARAAA
jgi:hypothetical protein